MVDRPLGQSNGRLEQIRPGQFAMRFVCHPVQSNCARDTDGNSALPGFHEFHDLAISHEHIDGCSGRSGFPAVVEDQALVFMLVDKHESTASDSGALWLDQPEDRMCSNGGINGMATFLQHLDSGGNRVRVGRSDHRAPVPGR
jgi:hypothetical protein